MVNGEFYVLWILPWLKKGPGWGKSHVLSKGCVRQCLSKCLSAETSPLWIWRLCTVTAEYQSWVCAHVHLFTLSVCMRVCLCNGKSGQPSELHLYSLIFCFYNMLLLPNSLAVIKSIRTIMTMTVLSWCRYDERLLWARHLNKCLTYIISFNAHNNPWERNLLHFFQARKPTLTRLSTFPR